MRNADSADSNKYAAAFLRSGFVHFCEVFGYLLLGGINGR
jgi:hypothetical protein